MKNTEREALRALWENVGDLANSAVRAQVRGALASQEDEIMCPFCCDDDFDLIGLKIHLHRYCEAYAGTPFSDPPTEETTENDDE